MTASRTGPCRNGTIHLVGDNPTTQGAVGGGWLDHAQRQPM
jgi:hypothetical protein